MLEYLALQVLLPPPFPLPSSLPCQLQLRLYESPQLPILQTQSSRYVALPIDSYALPSVFFLRSSSTCILSTFRHTTVVGTEVRSRLTAMNKQDSQATNDRVDGEEILIALASRQSFVGQPTQEIDGHPDVASLAVESSCSLELDNKTGCQSIELKATVDATLPVVEFLSLDESNSGNPSAAEPQDSLNANLAALKISAIRLSTLVFQLFIHTVHILLVGAKESIRAILHIAKVDIQAIVSIWLLWARIIVALLRVIPGVVGLITAILVLRVSAAWRSGRLLPGSPSQTSRGPSLPGADRRRAPRSAP